MRAISQFTIYSLNDVITSATAPVNPYLGQLWVDTSCSPPKTKVWNGSVWKEQNGTDVLSSDIQTLTTKEATLETNLNGLTSSVSLLTQEVDNNTSDITIISEDVSTLQQTATTLTAEVSTKADKEYGSASSTFGWSLTSSGFYLYSNATTVMSVTTSGLTVNGAINATSGTMGGMTINGYLRFGGNTLYYISANYNDSNYYIYLPGFKVDKASTAVFSGKLSAPSGTIGGFTISTSAIYKTKTTYNSTTSGVYVGTDGIGLGIGTFYVTSEGKLYANDAEISGTIMATSGEIGGFSIASSSLYSIKTAYSDTTAGVYVGTDGIGLGAGTFYVTSEGYLYATNGQIGGFSIGASGLTNSSGGSYIEITSGDYTTKLSANTAYCMYDTADGWKGWRLGLDQISISDYSSSKFAGIKILPTYLKRTSSSGYGNTIVSEGCITTISPHIYNVDSSTVIRNVTPFMVGIPREVRDSPYAAMNEWGAYLRFADHQTAELVYDSNYSGKWQMRNVSGSTYNLVDIVQHVNSHKFYFWYYSGSVSNDSRASITKTTHGLSTVTGAIVIPREKSIYGEGSSLSGDNNLINKRANYGVYISGTTVYVIVDTNGLPNGFYCIIFGY
ncbi:MAG: hypothetical protein PHX51_02420 [Clostridia bacterium]|nr:hypothetical protein [Clostridia bacterium]